MLGHMSSLKAECDPLWASQAWPTALMVFVQLLHRAGSLGSPGQYFEQLNIQVGTKDRKSLQQLPFKKPGRKLL
jgi:hypothetical protein